MRITSRFTAGMLAGGVLGVGGFLALVVWALSDGWSGDPTEGRAETD